jgi:hypothetical protein
MCRSDPYSDAETLPASLQLLACDIACQFLKMCSLEGAESCMQDVDVIFWATEKDVVEVELNDANLNHDVGGTVVQIWSSNKKPTTTCQLQTKTLA